MADVVAQEEALMRPQRRSRPLVDLVEVEDLVATLTEVERRLARRDGGGSDPADLDLLELQALVDLTLEREVA